MIEGRTFSADLDALTSAQRAAWLTPPAPREPNPEPQPDQALLEFTVASEKHKRAAAAERLIPRIHGTNH